MSPNECYPCPRSVQVGTRGIFYLGACGLWLEPSLRQKAPSWQADILIFSFSQAEDTLIFASL